MSTAFSPIVPSSGAGIDLNISLLSSTSRRKMLVVHIDLDSTEVLAILSVIEIFLM